MKIPITGLKQRFQTKDPQDSKRVPYLSQVLKGKFAINRSWKLVLTYFDNKKEMSGKNQKYDRFQIDTELKF